MNCYGFLASGETSTIAFVQGLLMIAQIIRKKVAWLSSVLHARRWESTLDRRRNGNQRIGALKCCRLTGHIIDGLKTFVSSSNGRRW